MNKRLKKLQLMFEEIHNNCGFGPSENIDDADKIDEYIENFIYEFSETNSEMFKYLDNLNESTGKSYLEILHEF